MKFRYLSLALASSSTNYNQIIQNINLPSCRNCIHYIPPTYTNFESTLSKCGKYGNKNIITDEITYDFAYSCRNDEKKCGIEGKDFEEEENIQLKIINHSLQQNALYVLLFSAVILSSISLSQYL